MPRFAATDTDFLLALAAGHGDCESAVDWWTVQASGHFIVPPTVYQELEDIARHGTGTARPPAEKAIACINGWGFLEGRLSPLQSGYALELAKKLQAKGIVENLGDGLIIAEAAFLGCIMIFSSKSELAYASHDSLTLALMEADTNADRVFIVSPEVVVQYLAGQQG